MEEISNKKIITIVDDDKFLLDMYSLKFSEKGYDVRAYMTGEECLAALREGMIPSIIIFDITMPVIDGMELLKTIKNDKMAPAAKMVALSNDSDEKAIKMCQDLGVDEYIIKAMLTPEELVQKVEHMIQ